KTNITRGLPKDAGFLTSGNIRPCLAETIAENRRSNGFVECFDSLYSLS
ncbi:MAG: hypothetical protein RIR90_2015, partial [Bacteroidota bacterium]